MPSVFQKLFDGFFALFLIFASIYVITNSYVDYTSRQFLRENPNQNIMEGTINFIPDNGRRYAVSLTTNHGRKSFNCQNSARIYDSEGCYIDPQTVAILTGKSVKIYSAKLPFVLWYENPYSVLTKIESDNQIYFDANAFDSPYRQFVDKCFSVFIAFIIILVNFLYFYPSKKLGIHIRKLLKKPPLDES